MVQLALASVVPCIAELVFARTLVAFGSNLMGACV